MHHSERCRSMEAKFRREAESESDLMTRERLLSQADGWHWLAKASRYISETQVDTDKILATILKKEGTDGFLSDGQKKAEATSQLERVVSGIDNVIKNSD
jgi:hypothetical protein